MHVTAHPDDEHGGVLTKLSRGDGARLALLTLNRGESGDNAIGPQLFDALGLIRTEELLVADRHYGVDEQYFTTVVDYGFSKRLEEALDKWGRETVVRDVVRLIRMSRPTIILSRFQGNERDGHGNHQTAGLMAVEGFRAAGDPKRYPEQIAEGPRPWQPKKVYIGGVRENEDWTVRIDSGEYSPRLGDSYDNVARYGLSFQRSQNVRPVHADGRAELRVLHARRRTTRFVRDGRRNRCSTASRLRSKRRSGPSGKPIDDAVAKAIAAFTMNNPSATVPALVQGLKLTREAMSATKDPDARFILDVKERQFQDAINSAMGLELTAIAQPVGLPRTDRPWRRVRTARTDGGPGAWTDLRGAGAAGQSRRHHRHGRGDPARSRSRLADPAGTGDGRSDARTPPAGDGAHDVTLAADVPLSTRPYFTRDGLQDSRYTLGDPSQFGKPVSTPPLRAIGRYVIDGVPIEVRETVRRREAKLPYGDVLREVRTVPRIAVAVTPGSAIVPIGQGARKAGSAARSGSHPAAQRRESVLRVR